MLHFLNGNYDLILKEIGKTDAGCGGSLEFEKAAEYGSYLLQCPKIAQKQKITDTAGEDRDILASGVRI